MTLAWRLASGRHPPLTGEGARLVGGRWNSPGRPLVYASESLALCLAECLVHVTGTLPQDYVAVRIEIPDDAVEVLDAERLPFGWEDAVGFTRAVGDAWLAQARSPVLAVPSAVLPHSTNLLIDPAHPRAGEIRVRGAQPFRFDPRLGPARRATM